VYGSAGISLTGSAASSSFAAPDRRPETTDSTSLTYSILHRRTARRRWLHAQRLKLRPLWRQARPFVVIALAIAVLVLGTVGFHEKSIRSSGETVFDSFYRALTLFGLGGVVGKKIPVELQIARILGPIITGYAAIQGLLALSREQAQLVWFRLFLRRHVVVAGLGSIGFRLAKSLNDAGFQVIAIEKDPANPAIAGCRERGVGVVTADATDPTVLRNTRCDRADLVVVTCGDDGANMDVATAATRVTEGRRTGVLTALIHVGDTALWRTLTAEELGVTRSAPIRLEFFNVFAAAALMLVERFPPFPHTEPVQGRHTCVVIGFDGLAESLALGSARVWCNADRRPGAGLRIALLGPTATSDRQRLLLRHPELQSICTLDAREVVSDAEFERGDLGLGGDDAWPVSSVYVCMADEADGLAVAMALRRRPETRHPPIVVTVADGGAGVASAVRDGSGILEDIDAFGVLSGTLKPELLLRGTNELLARAKHDEYVASQVAIGVPSGPPSMVPWDELSDDLKEANRRFADGIGAKLQAAGCALVPAPLTGTDGAGFADADIEQLARMEHERWMRDKIRDGWRYGPTRNDAAKIHPLLIPWEELPEEERDKDRNPMRELPQMLARVGLEIQRGPVQAPPGPIDADRPRAIRS
jgi:CheY-like chemotaxis protein